MSILFTKFLLFIFAIHAQIPPLNYDFTLKSLEIFTPGKTLEEIKKQYSNYDIFEDSGDQKILHFKIKRTGYILDVYTQTKKDTVTDLFVRLPQHFLHDLFLKELQLKWKKQDKFVRHDRSALYVWLNRDNSNIIYDGSCSITCFPMFIEIVSTDISVIPMYVKFNEALPKW